jgi:hypothetical protein
VLSQLVSSAEANIRCEKGTEVRVDADRLKGLVYQWRRIKRHILSIGGYCRIAPEALLDTEAVP